MNARKDKYPCFASCRENDDLSEEQIEEVGLLKDHAYAILDAKTFENFGDPVSLINLYSPWGRTEWNGEFCDGSDAWEKNAVYMTQEEAMDGNFWMKYEDFKKYFEDVTIVKYHDDFVLSSKTHIGSRKGTHLVKVDEPGRYYFSISQVSDKLDEGVPCDLNNPDRVRMFVLKLDDEDPLGSIASSDNVAFIAGGNTSESE